MATTTVIPQVTLPVGSRTFGPHTAADSETSVTLSIDRTVAGGLNSLTAASTLTIQAQMSTDGGATWHAVDNPATGTVTQASASGGTVTFTDHHTGQLVTLDVFTAGPWNLVTGTGRRVQAVITVAGAAPVAVAGSIATQ